MLQFARVIVCCSFHSCDSHPSTSLQLRGVRVKSISLKSRSVISIIDTPPPPPPPPPPHPPPPPPPPPPPLLLLPSSSSPPPPPLLLLTIR